MIMTTQTSIILSVVCYIILASAIPDDDKCGIKHVSSNTIADGAGYERWPWMVSIGEYQNGVWRHSCGGTIINRELILTAAHCVISKTKLIIRIGAFDLSSTKGVIRKSYLFFIHPKYNSKHAYFDVALVKIRDLEFSHDVQPICLPKPKWDENVFDNRFAYISGWGQYDFLSQNTSSHLRTGRLEVFPNSFCNESHAQIGLEYQSAVKTDLPDLFPPHAMCAGDYEPNKGTCKGDSGGPLKVRDTTSKQFTQIAVISARLGKGICGENENPSIFTRLDYPEVHSFIHAFMYFQQKEISLALIDSFSFNGTFGEYSGQIIMYGIGMVLFCSAKNGKLGGANQLVASNVEVNLLDSQNITSDIINGWGRFIFVSTDFDLPISQNTINSFMENSNGFTLLEAGHSLNGSINNPTHIKFIIGLGDTDEIELHGPPGVLTGSKLIDFPFNDPQGREKVALSLTYYNEINEIKYNAALNFKNGTVYDAEFSYNFLLNETLTGKGRIFFPRHDENGREKYEGQFFENRLEGFGTMNWRNGTVYAGEWNSNNPHGKGILFFPENDEESRVKYDGSFENGTISGRGKMTWKNGTNFDGEWKDGKPSLS